MLNKYQKRPVIITAIRFLPSTTTEDIRNAFEWAETAVDPFTYKDGCIYIPTLEGTMKANQGDWIIRGIHDAFYPCKNAIFEATYLKVE